MDAKKKYCMTSKFVFLNSETIIGLKTSGRRNLEEYSQTLNGCSVKSLLSVSNLGVLFDTNLPFESHISNI